MSVRRRKRKKIKVEALSAEKVTVRDLNVHCHTMTVPANSINIIVFAEMLRQVSILCLNIHYGMEF